MPTYEPPKRDQPYVFYVSLVSQANTKIMQASPNLVAVMCVWLSMMAHLLI